MSNVNSITFHDNDAQLKKLVNPIFIRKLAEVAKVYGAKIDEEEYDIIRNFVTYLADHANMEITDEQMEPYKAKEEVDEIFNGGDFHEWLSEQIRQAIKNRRR